MSYRWIKLLFVLMLAILSWMALSAFWRRQRAPELAFDKPAAETSPTVSAWSLHESHTKPAAPVSLPRHRATDPESPVPVDQLGRAQLDWDLLANVRIEGRSRRLPANLEALDGKTVRLTGFMCPENEMGEMHSFLLLEVPVGCFYCQTIPPAGIVLVELESGRRAPLAFEPVQVTGIWHVNRDDPEDYLYRIEEARLASID